MRHKPGSATQFVLQCGGGGGLSMHKISKSATCSAPLVAEKSLRVPCFGLQKLNLWVQWNILCFANPKKKRPKIRAHSQKYQASNGLKSKASDVRQLSGSLETSRKKGGALRGILRNLLAITVYARFMFFFKQINKQIYIYIYIISRASMAQGHGAFHTKTSMGRFRTPRPNHWPTQSSCRHGGG